MNATRDQAILGLALQNGLINQQQAVVVRERHQQFTQANRPVPISEILRALKLASDVDIQKLESAVDSTAPAAPANPRPTGGAPVIAPPRTPPQGVPLAQGAAPGTVRRATAATPAMPAPPPAGTLNSGIAPGALSTQMLGKYKILQQVGQGGMGAVYLAEDTHLNRKVALKVLPKALASNREFIKRFLAEARVTGKLSHPNIVVAYDIDSTQGIWYMAMEYLEGESIGNRLKRGEAIEWRAALLMVKQVCKGLTYAHKNGIVHRDIKPDNLFLDKSSNEAKILDMGLSKNLHATENSSLTQVGMILGTPNYLAPEQAENGVNVDKRADIYSLGATLFHILTGVPPFDGPTPLAIIQKHIFEPMPDVRKRKPEVPPDVANLIWKMTAKKVNERFSDCAEVIEAADDILEGRGFRLADPMAGGPRRSSGTGRNQTVGSGQRAAVRAGSASRITRTQSPVERKSRSMATMSDNKPWLITGAIGAVIVIVVIVIAVVSIKRSDEPKSGDKSTDTNTASTNSGDHRPGLPGNSPGGPTQPGPGPVTPAAEPSSAEILNVVNVASRGLFLANQVDEDLVLEENRKQLARMNQAAAHTTPTVPDPRNVPDPKPPDGAGDPPKPASKIAPRAGDRGLVRLLSAEEKKTAGDVLAAFEGPLVYRMKVPSVTQPNILAANISTAASRELNQLTVLQLGAPPKQIDKEVYQGVFIELNDQPKVKITESTRIRLLIKVEVDDKDPVEFRLLHSSLPNSQGSIVGGIVSKIVATDWALIDLPMQVYNEEVGEKDWFGYACGTGDDFTNQRKINMYLSDIVIYNPKP